MFHKTFILTYKYPLILWYFCSSLTYCKQHYSIQRQVSMTFVGIRFVDPQRYMFDSWCACFLHLFQNQLMWPDVHKKVQLHNLQVFWSWLWLQFGLHCRWLVEWRKISRPKRAPVCCLHMAARLASVWQLLWRPSVWSSFLQFWILC